MPSPYRIGGLPDSIDYTTKDRAAIERRIRSLIDSVFPTWSEKDRANFGNILLGLFAHVGDFHSYYVDQWARESRIASSQLRRSLLGLVKLIGYAPRGAAAASAEETFTLAAAMPAQLTLPAGSFVRTRSASTPVRFQLLADLTFEVGETSKTATVEHSETHVEQLASSGLPDQTFRLRRTPFLADDSSPAVSFADGGYEVVDNFLQSSATDRHVVVFVDANDRATLLFGNGVNGSVPIGTGTVTYKIGGGLEGAVDEDDLSVLEGTFRDDDGNLAAISVTNALASQGATPRESNAQIRRNAPEASRVLNRAVAREDFEIVAKQVTGVARALCVTSNEDSAVGENQAYLFIVPEGGGTATSALLDEVRSKFLQVTGYPAPAYPTINTLDLNVQSASYFDVDHQVRAYRAQGVSTAGLKAAVDDVLDDFYAETIAASRLLAIAPKVARAAGITEADGSSQIENPLVDFGFYYKDVDGNATGQLAWTDVHNVVRDLDEVRKLDADDGLYLNSARDDVTIGTFKFPRKGTVTVIDGDTGQTL